MTFEIFDSHNKLVLLTDFDHLYCTECGVQEDDVHYADWFHLLECVLNTYGCWADEVKEGYFKRKVVTDSRKLSLLQVAQCLLIWMGTSVFSDDTIVTVDEQYKYIHNFLGFALEHKNEYFFEFHF